MKTMRLICSFFLLILLLLAEVQVAGSLWDIEKEQKPVVQKPVSCPKSSGDDATVLKQFVGKLLQKFQPFMVAGQNDEKIQFYMEMKLSQIDLSKCSSYLANESEDIFEVEEVLTSMLGNINSDDKILLNKLPLTFLEKYSYAFAVVLLIIFVAFLAFSLTFVRLTFGILIKWLLFLVFMVSFLWNWYFLYQENMSKYRTAIENGPPEKCKENYTSSLWESFMSSISETFHMPVDECEEYYLITSISPAFRVPPTEALSFCIVNTMLKPLASLGKNIGLFLQQLSQYIPFHLQIVALIFILIIILFSIVIYNGYSVSTLLLTLTPPPPEPSSDCQGSIEIKEKLDRILLHLERLPNSDDAKDMREVIMKSIKQILESKQAQPRIEQSLASGDAPGNIG